MLPLAARRGGARALGGIGRMLSGGGGGSSTNWHARLARRVLAEGGRARPVCAAAAAVAVITTAATTTVAICDGKSSSSSKGSDQLDWKLTLGISALAAVLAGGVAALVMGRSGASDEDAAAALLEDAVPVDAAESGRPVRGCTVLPMPPRGLQAEGSSGGIVLNNGLGTRVSWGVASAQGPRRTMEDEWCAGIIVPHVDEDEGVERGAAGADGAAGIAGAAAVGAAAADPLYVVGVFDGHGGGMCSNWAARNMLQQVGRNISVESQLAAPRGAVEAALATLESQMTGKEAFLCGTTVRARAGV